MCRKSSLMERGVITEIPLHVLQMFSSLSPSISRPIGVISHTTPLSIRRGAGGEASVNSVCRRRSVSSKRWLKSSVKSVSSVRENTPQRVSKMFFFSQITQMNRTHSIPQRPCGRQISQNLTATFSSNALCTLYAGGLLWARNCAPKSSVNSVCSVRDKTPQRVTCVSSFREGAFFFSQKYTEEQNTKGFTETLSQPISQNLTANFGSNALCTLYAGGLL